MSREVFHEITKKLSGLDLDELRSLNRTVVNMIQYAGQQKAREFVIGDRVGFDAKSRGYIRGTITGFMTKNIKVLSDGGQPWKVSPALLKKIGN